MSAWEVTSWALFEREFGPLTLHERMDAMAKHISGKDFEWRSAEPVGEDGFVDWLKAMAS